MAEKITTQSTDPPANPAPAVPSNTAAIGSIVFVRTGISSQIPAIVVNDFQGQNAPGAVSLVAFLAEQFAATVPVKYIPMAQYETKDIPDAILIAEPFNWWHWPGEERVLKEEAPAQ